MNDLAIFLAVAALALGSAIGLAALGRSAPEGGPVGAQPPTHWLLARTPACLRRLGATLDRRVAGGLGAALAFVVIVVTAGTVGWILSTVDDGRRFARWDAAVAAFGRDHASATSTRALEIVTRLGGSPEVLILMALIAAFHATRRDDLGPLRYLATVGVGVALTNNALKLAIGRERPQIAQLADSAGSSFPSGHSATAAACWAAIALVLTRSSRRRIRTSAAAIACSLAVAIAATRVLLGVHWATDVVAGLLVGWAWWLVVTILFGGSMLRFGAPAELAAVAPVPRERIVTRHPHESNR